MSKRSRFALIDQWFESMQRPLAEEEDYLFGQLLDENGGCFVVKAFYVWINAEDGSPKFHYDTLTVKASDINSRHWFRTLDELKSYVIDTNKERFPHCQAELIAAFDCSAPVMEETR